MSKKNHLLVRGEIVLDPLAVSLTEADVYVSVEDTEFADGPAKKIEQIHLRDIDDIYKHRGCIPFEIYGDIPDKKKTLTVSVLVDLDGDGYSGKGDYINMESYPIILIDNPSGLNIRACKIK